MRIGIDIDDVLLDYCGALCNFFNENFSAEYNFRLTKDNFSSYNLKDFVRKNNQLINADNEKEIRKGFALSPNFNKIPILEGVKEGLDILSPGNELFIVSSRTIYTQDDAKRNLTLHGIDNRFNDMFFTNNKNNPSINFSKADICLTNKLDFMIEDDYEAASECSQKGIKTFLISQPWNWNYETMLPPYMERVSNLNRVAKRFS